MTSTTPVVNYIAFGKCDDMVAEVSACDFPADFGFRYYVMPVGVDEHSTEGCKTLAEAKAVAAEMARYFNVKTLRI